MTQAQRQMFSQYYPELSDETEQERDDIRIIDSDDYEFVSNLRQHNRHIPRGQTRNELKMDEI